MSLRLAQRVTGGEGQGLHSHQRDGQHQEAKDGILCFSSSVANPGGSLHRSYAKQFSLKPDFVSLCLSPVTY